MNDAMVLFSPSTCGVYLVGLNDQDIPADVIKISRGYWESILMQLATSPKKVAARATDGYPILVDPPSLSEEALILGERVWRDAQLAATDGIVSRHRDELEAGGGTTLAAAEYESLQTYRRDLRNWPATEKFPELAERPVLIAPASIAAVPVRKKRVRKPVQPVEPSLS